MMPYLKTKIIASSLLISCSVFFLFALFAIFKTHAAPVNFDSNSKNIFLADGGIEYELTSDADTVGDLIALQKINLNPNDLVVPTMGEKIYSGSHVIIYRAKKISIIEGGKTTDAYTLESTVEKTLWENKTDLGEDDITAPARTAPVTNGMKIKVTHVQIKEETKSEPIDFKTVSNEDDSLGWRIKKVTQKGEKGANEVKYKVVYYDGREISRKILEKNKTKDSVDEVVTQGTYVKVGKGARGEGTWYAFKGGLFAASRTIPRGGYAKVTNMDNGQSVIVQINDYGPQAPQRIIDLDKVAFAKIADLGAGVLHSVKVEQVLN